MKSASDNMPENLRKELSELYPALTRKYGQPACQLGAHIVNLARLCTQLADHEAGKAAATACYSVLRDLGKAWNVDPDSAYAVATALQDFTAHVEDEIRGERAMPEDVVAASAEVISTARKPD